MATTVVDYAEPIYGFLPLVEEIGRRLADGEQPLNNGEITLAAAVFSVG